MALNPAAPPSTVRPPQISSPSTTLQDLENQSSNMLESAGVGEAITKLADLFSQWQDRDALPRPEPELFNGDLLLHPLRIKSFETFIERRTKDPSKRLYYLASSQRARPGKRSMGCYLLKRNRPTPRPRESLQAGLAPFSGVKCISEENQRLAQDTFKWRPRS